MKGMRAEPGSRFSLLKREQIRADRGREPL